MNIVVPAFNFNVNNLFFIDKKKNTVIDGLFSKLIYSENYFTMNGLYFSLPFLNKLTEKKTISQNQEKYVIYFYPNHIMNIEYISKLCEIENMILSLYKKIHEIDKKSILSLCVNIR
jgi:hypothetical protein